MIRKKALRDSIDSVYTELDEHLDAINANTQELSENRAMIFALQEHLCKLQDSIDEMRLQLETTEEQTPFPKSIDLSAREKEVFLTLHSSQTPVAYGTISNNLTLPVGRVQEIVYSMIMKGVPIIKQVSDRGDIILSIDLEFSLLQSQNNILSIDTNFMKRFNSDIQSSLL